MIKIYEENKIDIKKLPKCEKFSPVGHYEGLWTSLFVKPLAWVIIQIGKLLTPFVLKNEFIAYETNMSAILPFITDYFEIGTESMKCLLKKN